MRVARSAVIVVVKDRNVPPYDTEPRPSSSLATPIPAASAIAHRNSSRREETRAGPFVQPLGTSLEFITDPMGVGARIS